MEKNCPRSQKIPACKNFSSHVCSKYILLVMFYIRLKIGFLGIPITKEMKEMGWDALSKKKSSSFKSKYTLTSVYAVLPFQGQGYVIYSNCFDIRKLSFNSLIVSIFKGCSNIYYYQNAIRKRQYIQ